LAKILPGGLSAREIAGNVRSFAKEHGAEHCAVLIGISARKEFAASFEHRVKEITGNKFVSCTTFPVTVDGGEQSATVAYPISLESRQEVLDAIDFGEITARDESLGVYVIRDTANYLFRTGAGPVVKNPDYVWDGCWPPGSLTRLKDQNTAITIRLDGVKPFEHFGLGKRVAQKILGPSSDRVDEGNYKDFTYITINGPANFDDFVKQAGAVAPVVRTVSERRVVILQIDPAKFPMQ